MNSTTQLSHRATATRDARRARRLLNEAAMRVFHPLSAHEAGIFHARKGGADLKARISVHAIDSLVAEGVLVLVRKTKAGRLFRAVPPGERVRPPRTAREHRNAAWNAAESAFAPRPSAEDPAQSQPDTPRDAPPIAIADSPIGWLARRRNSDGKPFLTREEVAAAERLRTDFERSQMAPGITQDWTRFLTSGVQGGKRVSAQERDLDGGASAARNRLSDALSALGPGLSDVALRVCCFLEGIEAIETSMHWSRRSGKVVLKIALTRLAAFYHDMSVRNSAAIESWQSEDQHLDHPT